MSLLRIEDLKIYYRTRSGVVQAVNGVSFDLEEGMTMGIVGESGCGKTTTAKAIMRLLPRNGWVEEGKIYFNGKNLFKVSSREMNSIRWQEISMIPQSSMNALDPVYTIEEQIEEAFKTHVNLEKKEIKKRIENLLGLVGLKVERAKDYPHQFSGGMLQRAIIAMSLALNPKLIIADEPTTALDVITQDTILHEISELKKKINVAMIICSHDISVIAETCNHIAVMYAGRIVEYGKTENVFKNPYNPYTLGLKNAFPSIRGELRKLISIPGYPPNLINPPSGCLFANRCPFVHEICRDEIPLLHEIEEGHFSACHRVKEIEEIRILADKVETWERDEKFYSFMEFGEEKKSETPIIEVKELKKYFPLRKSFLSTLFGKDGQDYLKAVDGIRFNIFKSEILGLAGESGSGKTSVGKTIVGLYEPSHGIVSFLGEEIKLFGREKRKELSRNAQMIFQNPYESLNPRQTVLEAVREGLKIHNIGSKKDKEDIVKEILIKVKLIPPEDFFERYPHQLSGGQRQRVAIARALVISPKLLVADEPVTMLDVSIRAGILNLLRDLTNEMGLASLFISHDLSVIRYICDRIAIMYLGKIVEIGETKDVIDSPHHPYTGLLLSAVPVPDPGIKRKRVRIKGEIPSPVNLPPGCRFAQRCYRAKDICYSMEPDETHTKGGHSFWCHNPL